jgi:hypothetical protein
MARALQPATAITEMVVEKKLPLAILPAQFFPDVELSTVSLTSEELVVTVSDSTWGLQSDITFFHGPGEMHFYYEGPARMHWKHLQKEQWNPGSLNLLSQLAYFDMIHKKNEIWYFLFRSVTIGANVEIFFEKITHIVWVGDGDDNIECEANTH